MYRHRLTVNYSSNHARQSLSNPVECWLNPAQFQHLESNSPETALIFIEGFVT